MTTIAQLQPGQKIRVTRREPVTEGIIRCIESDGSVIVHDPVHAEREGDGDIFFGRGDMLPIDQFHVEVLAPPGPVPPPPAEGTHWLGSDGVVYTHLHGWSSIGWCSPHSWDMTWAEVWWRANPLVQLTPTPAP